MVTLLWVVDRSTGEAPGGRPSRRTTLPLGVPGVGVVLGEEPFGVDLPDGDPYGAVGEGVVVVEEAGEFLLGALVGDVLEGLECVEVGPDVVVVGVRPPVL